MNDPIFISISQFIEWYSTARTKTHELINEGRLITGKVGRRTVILNASAKEFAASALRQGNLGDEAAEILINDLQAAGQSLCNIHSDQHTARVGSTSDASAIVGPLRPSRSLRKSFGENYHG